MGRVLEAPATRGTHVSAHHDHRACTDAVLVAAHEAAIARGVRLTDLRAEGLGIVAQSHKAIRAYEILERMQKARRQEKPVAPPTVYRALEFLAEQGFVHRINSLNAFVACYAAGEKHRGMFLICESCGTVAELADPDVDNAIAQAVRTAGYQASHEMIEITGICPSCKGI